ncbi:hypothetical protein [Streptomyces luteireticuli]|uniref:DUF222 domain-containing protein n=1 Tax=Streptomyces luteireticuli TaxID=173858 RepID=A0ABP3I0P8_9ACTN
MNLDETIRFLNITDALSGVRDKGDDETKLFRARLVQALLAEVPVDAAMECLHEHHKVSKWAMVPAEVIECWKAKRMAILGGVAEPAPEADPDDAIAYVQALRHQRGQAAVTGVWPTASRSELVTNTSAVEAAVDQVGRPPQGLLDKLRTKLGWRARMPCLDKPCQQCGAAPGEVCTHLAKGSKPGKITGYETRSTLVPDEERPGQMVEHTYKMPVREAGLPSLRQPLRCGCHPSRVEAARAEL